jgi:hypothetical protein
MTSLKIAIWFLIALLVIRIMHHLWQKVCMARTGEKFQFLLTKFRFEEEVTWKDVRYSFLVVLDSAVLLLILIWITGEIF